jgi:hypothetical protein
MRTIKLSLFISLLLISKIACGDIIVVSPKKVDVCIKISNLAEYPNIVLIEYVDHAVLLNSKRAYKIKSNDCLEGNNISSAYVYAVKKEYLVNKDIKNIDWSNDNNVLKTNLTIKGTSFLTNESIRSVEQFYRIVGFTDTSVVLFKEKQVIKYTDDRSDSTNTFIYKGDISKLKQDMK